MNKADKLKHIALKKALELGEAKILIDANKLCKPESPIYNPWEVLLPILAPLLIGLIILMSVGIIFGLIFMILMIVIFIRFVKRYLYIRLIKRAKEYMSSNYNNCQELWEYGGIVLTSSKDQKTGCISPDGNWKDFVTLNFADYMTEKKEDSTTDLAA